MHCGSWMLIGIVSWKFALHWAEDSCQTTAQMSVQDGGGIIGVTGEWRDILGSWLLILVLGCLLIIFAILCSIA